MARVVVITGASSGIGKATAEYYKNKGDIVYNLARRENCDVNNVRTDIAVKEQVFNAVGQIADKEGRIDILVNSAGMGIAGDVENTTDGAMRKIFDINLFGSVYAIQAALPLMRRGGGGYIVNIASAGAPLSLPFQAFYSSTKSALISLAEALSIEVAPFKLKVTNILPGDIVTEFTSKRETDNNNSVYSNRVNKSIEKMSKDELNGMQPSYIAKQIYKVTARKNPPVNLTCGASYKLFVWLSKVMPKKLIVFLIGKLYG